MDFNLRRAFGFAEVLRTDRSTFDRSFEPLFAFSKCTPLPQERNHAWSRDDGEPWWPRRSRRRSSHGAPLAPPGTAAAAFLQLDRLRRGGREGSEEQSQKQQQQHTVTFTGTIRPYAMSPFSCGTVRPSSQQSGKQRRIQNVLDQLDPKVDRVATQSYTRMGENERETKKERKNRNRLNESRLFLLLRLTRLLLVLFGAGTGEMSPVALKQYLMAGRSQLALRGRAVKTPARGTAPVAGAPTATPAAPAPVGGAGATLTTVGRRQRRCEWSSSRRQGHGTPTGPYVLSDADLAVTRRCKVSE